MASSYWQKIKTLTSISPSLALIFILRKLSYRSKVLIKKLQSKQGYLTDRQFFTTFKLHLLGADKIFDYFRGRSNPKFFHNLDDRSQLAVLIKEKFTESFLVTIQKADRALAHAFDLLGSGPKDLGRPINWFSDFNQKSWPSSGYHLELQNGLFRNDFQNPDYIGDIKLPWELNKHAHFVDLGRAYWLTGEEKYAREYIGQITDWIEKNPYGQGINWAANLVVSQRLISWIFSLNFFLDSPHLTPEVFLKILKSMYEHANFISENFEFASRASNHLFSNISALLFFSLAFPEFKKAPRWRITCQKIFESELEKQVYDDGVQYEESTGYHRYVVEFCLLPLMLGKINNRSIFSEKSEKKIEKMLEFIMHMTQPDGRVQPISDADGARVWNFNNADINDHRSYLALGSTIFNRPDFKYVAAGNYEELIWFLGEEGLKKYNDIQEEEPKEKSKAFPLGGYFISRDGWRKNSNWLFFDCGHIGMGDWPDELSVGTHGHSDILNFGLAIGGETIFTDNGSFTYTGSKKWHDYFRGSFVHNVITVDNEDQSILTGTWSIKKRARPQDVRYFFSDEFDFLSGGHDGFRRLSDPVFHRRNILFLKKKSLIIVKDELSGSDIHQIDFRLHSVHKCDIKKEGGKLVLIKEGIGISVGFWANGQNIGGNIYRGEEDPIRGWHAPDYGIKVPAIEIVFSFKEKLPVECFTILTYNGELVTSREIEELYNYYRFRIGK